MPQIVIENPVLNSPFEEPQRHFKFNDDGITDEIAEGRRRSSYFVPIARPRKKGGQLQLYGDWTQDRLEETKLVNDIRQSVARWRQGGYVDITTTSRRLLDYWTHPDREKKFFFCQIEALETAIYLTEVARKYDPWIDSALRVANEGANPGLFRIAFKMATGTGKTVVMAMIIAWQALNKLANPKDARFADAFLIIAPGITIRDRLRVLLPTDPNNYYRQRDVVPSYLLEDLGKAKLVVTNFHGFQLRETVQAAKLTKSILGRGAAGAFTETPDQMVRRVLRELGAKKNIVVLNDEAHHCYARRPEADSDKDRLKGDDRKEAEKRDEEARIWLNGLLAIKNKIGLRAIYDLSATPFFLRGSGYQEGTLFPWVVSDFSLIDAIEAGLVKVPRVPVSDDSGTGESPTYRDLWLRVRDELPKKGRGVDAVTGEPKLPLALQGALHTLYSNYQHYYRLWEQDTDAQARGAMPPVFIVVASNTNVSKLIYDYIAGWEKEIAGRPMAQAGALAIFRNDDGRGGWLDRPNTILVDSEQLESGQGMSDEFKQVAARELDEFKAEYRQRFPGRDTDKLTDEDLLREVMNTVGKPGKLGEHVKCVVSVSMLTEGWDANTVTHVLGVRAFGTQLLSEQVIGRALRRISYQTGEDGKFPAEYAEVFGVPFSFVPVAGSQGGAAKPTAAPTRVRALDNRQDCAIAFPRLQGYRYELPAERLAVRFTADSHLALSTKDLPTRVENAPIVGESATLTLDDLKKRRPAEVAFRLADLLLRTYFRDEEGADRPWLFPQLLGFCKRWMAECLTLKDGAFPQMLLFIEPANDAVDRIYKAIVQATSGTPRLKPILYPYDPTGSTEYVDFDTTRTVYATHFQKCHINYVTLDSDWEAVLAERIENMPEVVRYVKNQGLGFTIPYTLNGVQHQYTPDYILCIDDGHGPHDLLHLLIEVTGEKKKDKEAKVSTAATLWTPAVNNHGRFGRWAFLEITDPWNAVNDIQAKLKAGQTT
jgi:type III restriction enzyme